MTSLILECNVFTLPFNISGKFVTSSIGRARIPSACKAFSVPPVDIISKFRSISACPNSTICSLFDTLINARLVIRNHLSQTNHLKVHKQNEDKVYVQQFESDFLMKQMYHRD